MNTYTKVLWSIAIVSTLLLGYLYTNRSSNVLGNIAPTAEYTLSTTTPQVADRTVLCGGSTRNVGSVGTVNILSMTGELALFDATTTDVTQRTGALATSSIIIAWFPAGSGTSTVPLDIAFKNGLLVDYAGVGTTTITYRCGA